MASKTSNSPKIIINQLLLIGTRKNYSVPFHPGLNIIHGDSDTGKSSILDLIDYCLGGKDIDMYDELQSSAEYCLLEVSLNDKIFTISRDIFDSGKNIKIYSADILGMDTVFPIEYTTSVSKANEDI